MNTELLPYLVNIPGGIVMALALYGFVSGKVTTQKNADREVTIYKGLYEGEKATVEKVEALNDGLIKDLSTQNASHLETIRLLERFIPPTGRFSRESHPGRRADDVQTP